MDSELVKQIKDLAFELSVPRPKPGRVELRTQSRAEKIRLELIKLYNAEPRPESKRLVTRHNGLSISKIRRWKSQTVKAGILESMIGFLIPAVWGKSSFSDTERETVIQAAVQALPELCEKLQAEDGESIPKMYSKPFPTKTIRERLGKDGIEMPLATWGRRRKSLGDEIIDSELRGPQAVRITAIAAQALGFSHQDLKFDYSPERESSTQ